MATIKVITPPVGLPVTLAETKAFLRVPSSDTSQDALLTSLITAAVEFFEKKLQIGFLTQTIDQYQDEFPSGKKGIILVRYPVQSITYLKYYNTANVLTTFSTIESDLVSKPSWVYPAINYEWPNIRDMINSVIIRYVIGYTTVPDQLKYAVMLYCSNHYKRRMPDADTEKFNNMLLSLVQSYRLVY